MKNYAAIFLLAIISLTALAGTGTAQEVNDSYFANQVKLSKPQAIESKAIETQNVESKTIETQNGGGTSYDNFDDPRMLVLGSGGTSQYTTTNVGATKEAGEPNHAENAGGGSIWFKFTPAETKTFEIRTLSGDTDFDTTLAVYTGDSLESLAPVGYNDDCYANLCSTRSRVHLLLTAGVTYRIAVDGYNNGASTASGTFRIFIEKHEAAFEYDNVLNAYELGFINAASIAATNHLATGEAGEQNHSGSGNQNSGKSVWYRFRVPSNRALTIQTRDDFRSEMAVYESPGGFPVFSQMNRIDDASDNLSVYTPGVNSLNFYAEASRYYFIAIDWDDTNAATPTGNFQLKIFQTKLSYSMRRYDSEPFASISVFRPASTTWYLLPFNNPVQGTYKKFGLAGDVPVPADYDGDALTNVAVTRNQNGLKHWYILHQYDDTGYTSFQWGLASDRSLTGDFDRDGLADAVAIRSANGNLVWYVRQSSNGAMRAFVFGLPQDRPVIGDFDGDGATEVAVIRKEGSNLVWYILRSGGDQSYTQASVTLFGFDTDLPAAEDFDGDGKTDIAIFRPSEGTWYIMRSGSGELQVTQFGASGDKPQPADYDGDGKADLAVYRPSTGDWYLWHTATNTQAIAHWGASNDTPLSSLNMLIQ